MHAIHRLVGCALLIAGIGNAAATSADTQDMGGTAPSTMDSASTSGCSASGGDATGLNHDASSAGDVGNAGGSAQGSSHHSGGSSTAPLPTHRPHLGWQSLLPGSIQ